MSKNTTKRKKEFGVIGLGRMGGDLALQAIENGWRVAGYNRSPVRARACVSCRGEGGGGFSSGNLRRAQTLYR